MLRLQSDTECSVPSAEFSLGDTGGKNGKTTAGSVILRCLVFFPNMSAFIYFSES